MHFFIFESSDTLMPVATTHLYVPADSDRKIASAARVAPTSVILDLEDALAESAKGPALERLADSVKLLNHKDTWVRLNPGELGRVELEHISGLSGITGVWFAKAEFDAGFESQLAIATKSGLQVGVLIESAAGYLRRHELLVSKSVTRVQIGEYDLRGELGMADPGPETEYHLDGVRTEIVIAAVAAGITSIVSGVSANYSDLEQFAQSCQHMRDLGFNGRAVIHPAQVSVAHGVFTPTDEEVAWASELLSRFEAEIAQGIGAYRDEAGNMADAATVRRARRIVDQAGRGN
jgi:citrate lyase subunit beta / citryl-CoA lyase